MADIQRLVGFEFVDGKGVGEIGGSYTPIKSYVRGQTRKVVKWDERYGTRLVVFFNFPFDPQKINLV